MLKLVFSVILYRIERISLFYNMNAHDLKFLNVFNHIRGVGPTVLHTLKNHFGSFEAAWNATPSHLSSSPLSSRMQETITAQKPHLDPNREMGKLVKENIWIVTQESKEFPAILKEIPQSPLALYGQGSPSLLSLDTESRSRIGIVGTRKPTRYGSEAAEIITRELAARGIIIVSGLATGIDTIAHKSALDSKGKTIAVLGSGIDRASLFPRENRKLADKIVETGSLIVSEYPPGTPAFKENFPQRNRIISGMARGIIVVEAREKSGALITAGLALDQNRDVFAVPGSILSPTSFGTHALIQEGAKLVTSAKDIFAEWNIDYSEKTKTAHAAEISEKENKILALLEEPLNVDAIKARIGLETGTIIASLSLLELKGLVRNLGGDMYQKI